jgi:hypothetical protein
MGCHVKKYIQKVEAYLETSIQLLNIMGKNKQ